MRFFLFWFLVPIILLAHPHVFVDVELDIILNKTEADVKIIWRFDEMTSSMILMDFDMNGDGKLDEKESIFLKEEAFDHLKSLGYYTVISIDKKEFSPHSIDSFRAYFEENKILYEFSFSFQIPEKIKSFNIGCYDEDNLVAFFLSPSIKVLAKKGKISCFA